MTLCAFDTAVFDPALRRWALVADGDPIVTRAARLLPVRRAGEPFMLKLALEAEERRGAALMTWWEGAGAARVNAHHGEAILLERALGPRSLAQWSREGRDDDATRVLCDAIAALHAPRTGPRPDLVPLTRWFGELQAAASAQGGMLALAAATARALLADPRDEVVLHGDIHHDNVLDFGARGWLAIDPKGLAGERGFDYANLFCNPDVGDESCAVARRPERFERRVALVSERAGLERRRLLQWIVAWAGLSAAWFLGDGDEAGVDFEIMALATAALDR